MRLRDIFTSKRLMVLSAVIFAFQLNAKAEEDVPAFQWHGYGNLANSRIYQEQDQSTGAGYGSVSKRGTFLYNSILGLNMSYIFNDQITFYGQITAIGSISSDGDLTDSYPVRADMIFLNYHPFDWIDIRVGRQIIPLWMYSEQIDVSATYPWIRPPSDVYNLSPLKSANGIGVDITQTFANVLDMKAGIRLGDGTYTDPPYYKWVNLTNIVIGYAEFRYNNIFFLRASYGQTQVLSENIDTFTATPAIWNGLNGKTGSKTAGNLIALPGIKAANSKWQTDFHFYSLGGKVEYKNWQLLGEFAALNQKFDSPTPNSSSNLVLVPGGNFQYSSWYLTAAYHLDDWTPHLTFSQAEKNYHSEDYSKIVGMDYGMDSANIGYGVRNYNTMFGQAFADMIASQGFNPSFKVRTITAGLNYNFTPVIIGKVQVEQVRTSADADLIQPGAGAQYFNAVANGLGVTGSPYSPVRPKTMSLNGQVMSANDIMTIGEVAVAFVF